MTASHTHTWVITAVCTHSGVVILISDVPLPRQPNHSCWKIYLCSHGRLWPVYSTWSGGKWQRGQRMEGRMRGRETDKREVVFKKSVWGAVMTVVKVCSFIEQIWSRLFHTAGISLVEGIKGERGTRAINGSSDIRRHFHLYKHRNPSATDTYEWKHIAWSESQQSDGSFCAQMSLRAGHWRVTARKSIIRAPKTTQGEGYTNKWTKYASTVYEKTHSDCTGETLMRLTRGERTWSGRKKM